MRADAERNRDAVLAAAGRLFDEASDPDQVSMDAIAAAAGVGKGTLFRRFGDRTGLVRALYERRARHLHDTLTESLVAPTPATSGVGARPPAERALELLRALLRFKMDNRVLTLALENAGGGSPYRTEMYDRAHALLTDLVTRARGPRSAEYLAHALLSAVRSDLVEYLREWPDQRWDTDLMTLVDAVLRRS